MYPWVVYTAETIDDFLPLPGTIEDLTLTAALIVGVVAFLKEWVVPGAREKRLESQLSKILEAMNKLTDSVEKQADVNDELIRRLDRN